MKQMAVAAAVGLLLLTFAALGLYELLVAPAGDSTVTKDVRRRNAAFLLLASVGALGLCAAMAASFSSGASDDPALSWEARDARIAVEQRIVSIGVIAAAISSLIALGVPRRESPWALKIAAMVPLPLALLWLAVVLWIVMQMRIQ